MHSGNLVLKYLINFASVFPGLQILSKQSNVETDVQMDCFGFVLIALDVGQRYL